MAIVDPIVKASSCEIAIKENFRARDDLHWTRTEKRQWASGLFCGAAMLYAARTIMPFCVVSIAKEMDWDKTDAGTVMSAFFWGYTMTQFLGGYLSDRIGGDVVLPIAACVWSLITFWTPQLAYLSTDKHNTLYILTLSRVLLGISQGVQMPATTSLVCYHVAEHERSSYNGLVVSGTYAGTLLTGSVGSILLDHYGWQVPFYVIGCGGLLWMLVMRYCLIDRHRKRFISTVPDTSLLKQPSSSVPWVVLFTKAAFWSLIVGHFCENNAFYILLSWLPTYFHENFPTAKGWVFNVVPWLVTIPSSIFGGWLADHMIRGGHSVTYVRKLMETIALCGTALFLVLINYTTSYLGCLTCMALAVACCGFHNSGILVNPQDIAPRHAGSVFGIMNMAGAIPGFIGVYIAGHILEATKSWSAVFNQTAAVCMFGWVVYMLFGTGKKII